MDSDVWAKFIEIAKYVLLLLLIAAAVVGSVVTALVMRSR
jgi:hypothetical protein